MRVSGLGFRVWSLGCGSHTMWSVHIMFPFSLRAEDATRSNRKSTLPPHGATSLKSGGAGNAESRWYVAHKATGGHAAGGPIPVGRSTRQLPLLVLGVCFREKAFERLETLKGHTTGAGARVLVAARFLFAEFDEVTEVALERWRS